MKITDYLRDFPGGDGVAGVTVTVKKHSDGSTVGTDTTDANGLFEVTVDGSPGDVYYEATSGGVTKRHSSRSAGQAGPVQLGEFHYLLDGVFGSGVLQDQLGGLAPSADGVGMNVDIATGAALVKGYEFVNHTADVLTISANSSGNPRIDRVVVRATLSGTDIGKTELAVLTGTAAASPSAPALTRSSSTYEISLCKVAVANGASSISNANVTDERSDETVCGYVGAQPVNREESQFQRTLHAASSWTDVTSTGGAEVTPLQTSVTLVSGVTYDVFCIGQLRMKGTNDSAEGGVAVYIENATGANLSSYDDDDFGTVRTPIQAQHKRAVVGTGAAITCGLYARKVAGAPQRKRGWLMVLAIPR
jgi:hypothetical protein